jgi:hypothetical protein
MKFRFVLIGLFTFVIARSQNLLWHHKIGNEQYESVSDITLDGSENVIITGNFDHSLDFNPSPSGVFSLTPNGFSDVYVCKFNSNGQFLWAKSIGDQFNDLARSVTTDASGNIYVTGIFDGTVDFDPGPSTFTLSSTGPGNGFVLKLDPQGNFLWARAFTSTAQNEGTRLACDASGNVWITGYFSGTANFNSGGTSAQNLTAKGATDAFLVGFDASGSFLFARNFGNASSNAFGKSVCTHPNGNASLLIEFTNQCDADPSNAVIIHTSQGYSDLLVVTLTSSGNYMSSFSFGGLYHEFGFEIKTNSNGDIFVGGSFYSYQIDFDPGPANANFTNKGGLDGFVAKYTPNGQYLQAWQFGGTGDDEANGVKIDNNGNIIIHGWFENVMDANPGTAIQNVTSIGAHDAFVVALNAGGNYIKSFTYGGAYFCDNSYCGTSDDMIFMATNGNGMLYCTSASSGTNVTFFPNTPWQVVTASTGAYDVFNFKINFNLTTSFLEEPAGTNEIKAYPNPCSQNINISHVHECSSVEILDMTGKKILGIVPSYKNYLTLDVHNLNSGIYFIRVRFEEKEKVIKFVKD